MRGWSPSDCICASKNARYFGGGHDRQNVVKCRGATRGCAGATQSCFGVAGRGSHGAFTWGVLDRLLEDATLEIIGVTGTSAGAMHGAVLVDGLVRGGPEQPAQNFDGTGGQLVPCPDSAAFSQKFPGRRLPPRLSKTFLLTSRP